MVSCLIGENRFNLCESKVEKEDLKKWSNKNILICPACKKPYEYCHGKIISPYFRHKDKEECIDNYSESETDEHIKGKIDLYSWLKRIDNVYDIVLEGCLKETNQRPDIMFKIDNKQYVIEYQCTPISSEYYERHELYKNSGIKNIWICGTLKYFQSLHKGHGIKRLNTLEKECGFYYDSINKNFYDVKNFKFERKIFNLLLRKRTYMHCMKDMNDFKNGMENYYEIKDENLSCYRKNDWSGGGYYPSSSYVFQENFSFGKCTKLKDLKFNTLNK